MLTPPTVIFIISLSAIPIMYIVNTVPLFSSETGLFISGVVLLSLMCLVTYISVKKTSTERVDPFLYGKEIYNSPVIYCY
jgi:hypothetical protein